MKKTIFTLANLLIALTLGLNLRAQIMITQVYEGLSYNKFVEITNVGTTPVNLATSQINIKLYSNKTEIGTNTPTGTKNLTGTLNAGQCFILRHGSSTTPAYAVSYTPSDTSSNTANFNGTGSSSNPTASTDIIALYEGTTLKDVFSWGTLQYKDTSYYRNANISAPNTTWTPSEWTIVSRSVVENAQPSTPERLGYHGAASVNPTLSITSPANNSTINSINTNVTFSVQNFVVGQPGGTGVNGHIHYTLDNGTVVMYYSTNPISLTGLTVGQHTLNMSLVDNSHNQLNPPVTSSVSFTVDTSTAVLTIAQARAMGAGAVVTVRGIVSNGAELGAIRYLEDATAGIAAYGTPVANVNRGDMITVTGTLKDYKQLLEIDPVTNVTVISTGNTLWGPQVITPAQVGENYEAELIKIINGNFADTGRFALNTNYTFTSGGTPLVVRVSGATNPIIGTQIPTNLVDLTSICSQYHATDPTLGYQLLVRGANDISPATGVNNIFQSNNVLIYPNPANNYINLSNLNTNYIDIKITNIIGQDVKTINCVDKVSVNVDVTDINNGVYFITLIDKNNTAKTYKFIKE